MALAALLSVLRSPLQVLPRLLGLGHEKVVRAVVHVHASGIVGVDHRGHDPASTAVVRLRLRVAIECSRACLRETPERAASRPHWGRRQAPALEAGRYRNVLELALLAQGAAEKGLVIVIGVLGVLEQKHRRVAEPVAVIAVGRRHLLKHDREALDIVLWKIIVPPLEGNVSDLLHAVTERGGEKLVHFLPLKETLEVLAPAQVADEVVEVQSAELVAVRGVDSKDWHSLDVCTAAESKDPLGHVFIDKRQQARRTLLRFGKVTILVSSRQESKR